jgi:hypothetical protein
MCHRCYRQKTWVDHVVTTLFVCSFFVFPPAYIAYDAVGMPSRDDVGQVTQKRVVNNDGDPQLVVHVHAPDGFGRDDVVDVDLFNRLKVGSKAIISVHRYRIGHREQAEGIRYPT